MVAASEYATILEAASLDTHNEVIMLDMISDASGGNLDGLNYQIIEDGGDYRVFKKLFTNEIIVAVRRNATSVKRIVKTLNELKKVHGKVSVTGYRQGGKIAAAAAAKTDTFGVVFEKDPSPLDGVSEVIGKALGYHYKNVINFTDCRGRQADCPEDSGIILNIPPVHGPAHARVRDYIMGGYLIMDDDKIADVMRDTNRRVYIRNAKGGEPVTIFGIDTSKHMKRGAAIYAGYKSVLLSVKKATPWLRLLNNARLNAVLDRLTTTIDVLSGAESRAVARGKALTARVKRALFNRISDRIEEVNEQRVNFQQFLDLLDEDVAAAGEAAAAELPPGVGIDPVEPEVVEAVPDDITQLFRNIRRLNEINDEARALEEKVDKVVEPELTPQEKTTLNNTIEEIKEAHEQEIKTGEELGVEASTKAPADIQRPRTKRTASTPEELSEYQKIQKQFDEAPTEDIEMPLASSDQQSMLRGEDAGDIGEMESEAFTPAVEGVTKQVPSLTEEQEQLYDELIKGDLSNPEFDRVLTRLESAYEKAAAQRESITEQKVAATIEAQDPALDEFIEKFKKLSEAEKQEHLTMIEEQLDTPGISEAEINMLEKQHSRLLSLTEAPPEPPAAPPPPPDVPPPPRRHPLEPYRSLKGERVISKQRARERRGITERVARRKPPEEIKAADEPVEAQPEPVEGELFEGGTRLVEPEIDPEVAEMEARFESVFGEKISDFLDRTPLPSDEETLKELEELMKLGEEEEVKTPALEMGQQRVQIRTRVWEMQIENLEEAEEGFNIETLEDVATRLWFDNSIPLGKRIELVNRIGALKPKAIEGAPQQVPIIEEGPPTMGDMAAEVGEAAQTDWRDHMYKLDNATTTEETAEIEMEILQNTNLTGEQLTGLLREVASVNESIAMEAARDITAVEQEVSRFAGVLGDVKAVLAEAGDVLGGLGLLAALGIGIYTEIQEARSREEIRAKIHSARNLYSEQFHQALNKLGVHVKHPEFSKSWVKGLHGQSEADWYGPQALSYVKWMASHPDVSGDVKGTVEKIGELYRSMISPGPLFVERGEAHHGLGAEGDIDRAYYDWQRSLPRAKRRFFSLRYNAAVFLQEWQALMKRNIEEHGDEYQKRIQKLMEAHKVTPFRKLTDEQKKDLLTSEESNLYVGEDSAEQIIIAQLAAKAKDIVNIIQRIANRQPHERNFMAAAQGLYLQYVKLMSTDLSDDVNRKAVVDFLKRNVDAFIRGIQTLINDNLMYNAFAFNKADMNSYRVYVSAGTMKQRQEWHTTLIGNEEKKKKLEEWLEKDEYSMKAYIKAGHAKQGDFETEAQFVDRYTRWVQDTAAAWEWRTHRAILPAGEGVYNPDQDYRLQLPDEFHVPPTQVGEVKTRCVPKRKAADLAPTTKRQRVDDTDKDEQWWKNHFSKFQLEPQYYAAM